MNQKQGAKELVERARAGDQNAMAMLEQVGKNARAGNPKAKSAQDLILAFIKTHPVQEHTIKVAGFAADEKQALGVFKETSNPIDAIIDTLCTLPFFGNSMLVPVSCVLLSKWPNWNKERVKTIDQTFIGNDQNLFRFGYESSADSKRVRPVAKNVGAEGIGKLCVGHCIGTARRIQLARLPQVPVSVLGPDVGWELGCA